MREAPMRCAECNCEHGGYDCNWINSPITGKEHARIVAETATAARKAAFEEAASVLRSRLDRIGLAVITGSASNPAMCLSKIELLEEEIAAIRALA